MQKLSILAVAVALLCYSAVSPHTLPTAEYNLKFFENLKIISLSMIAPLSVFTMVFDPKESNANDAVSVGGLLLRSGISCQSNEDLFASLQGQCFLHCLHRRIRFCFSA